MRFFILLFMVVLLPPMLAFPPIGLNTYLVSNNNNIGFTCNNMTHWKNVVEKVKKEHPTAAPQELVKFISHEIMKDSSHPMYAEAQIIYEDVDGEKKHVVDYSNFVGTLEDGLNLFLNDIYECDIDKNLSLGIILRKKSTEQFIPLKWKSIFGNSKKMQIAMNQGSVLRSLLKMNASQYSPFNRVDVKLPPPCSTTFPDVQALIDKFDKMGISNVDEWNRQFMEEFKANFKPLEASVSKWNVKEDKESLVSIKDEQSEDVGRCEYGTESPKCHSCHSMNGIDVVVFHFFEQ